MFALLVLAVGADPTAFTVVNRCPPAFVVVNHCPAKPAKAANGFNCGAAFCGANGGAGCPACPNGNGTCACGAKVAVATAAPAPPAPVQFSLPQSQSVCGPGGCAQSGYSAPAFRPLGGLFGGRR